MDPSEGRNAVPPSLPFETRQCHSGLGIASLSVSLVAGVGILGLLAIAGIIHANTPGGMNEKSPIAVVVGLVLFVFMGIGMVGLGLGIAGFFQGERKKVFPVLGTCLSALVLLGTLLIVLSGLNTR